MPKKLQLTPTKVDRLIRSGGAERVSKGAVEWLNRYLTEKGLDIAKSAIELARYSGRKTVQEKDIIFAMANENH